MRIVLNSAGRLAALCTGVVLVLSLAGWGLQIRAEESWRAEIRRRAGELVPEGTEVSAWQQPPEVPEAQEAQEKAAHGAASEAEAVEYRNLAPARDRGASRLIILRGEGYGGTLWAGAVYDADGTVLAYRVLFHREYPGYGPVLGENLSPSADQVGEYPDAAAGATMTRQSLVQILEKGSRLARELGRQNNG